MTLRLEVNKYYRSGHGITTKIVRYDPFIPHPYIGANGNEYRKDGTFNPGGDDEDRVEISLRNLIEEVPVGDACDQSLGDILAQALADKVKIIDVDRYIDKIVLDLDRRHHGPSFEVYIRINGKMIRVGTHTLQFK